MRKKIKPLFVYAFFALFFLLIIASRGGAKQTVQELATVDEPIVIEKPTTETKKKTSDLMYIDDALEMKPIIDISGWQLPEEIDYDTLSQNISGAIIRVQSGISTKKDNGASDANGIDKQFKTHIKEFQARGVPVAVYAYVTGHSEEAMKTEAKSFYESASPFNPTYYWLDVEEKTMDDMNKGVEVFRKELESLGAKKIGIYIGTYFMDEHSIKTDKFSAIWIPTYGANNGYYNAAPNTDLDYDLHQYTSKGYVNGFSKELDLSILTTLKDPNEIYQKLFTTPEK